MREGCLYGVGVGPGDPEWLTLRARRLLGEVDHLFLPRACGRPPVAREIVATFLDPARHRVTWLPFPTAPSRPRGAPGVWEEHARAVAAVLARGDDALFLTEGDPTFFSSFLLLQRALLRLRPAARVQVVPGISSLHAAAAAAGLPLVSGDETLAVLPASRPAGELRRALESFDTVVLVKVAPDLERVLALLEELDLLDSTVCVERCGLPGQRVIWNLKAAGLRAGDLDYLSLFLVRRGRGAGTGVDR